MLLVYTDSITNRKKYIFNVLFFNVLGVEYQLTEKRSDFDAFQGPKFAYGRFAQEEVAPLLPASGLLDETGVRQQPEKIVERNGCGLLFPVGANSFSPCDIFSLSFYLITRYEEYADNDRDEHGRYKLKNSTAYKCGFYRKPLVQILAYDFAEKLKTFFPEFEYKKPETKIVYTCDVDIAYKYKGKGVWRWAAGCLRSLLHGDFADTANFLKSAFGSELHDPFDVYGNTRLFSEKYGIPVIHFIPTGPYGRFDKNISPSTNLFKKLIDELSLFSEIGLHPSYNSFGNQAKLNREKKYLEAVLPHHVSKSRQHYLLFSFPDTPRQLLAAGLTDDYTLGWAEDVGFRCSIAVPYPFYDLEKEAETELTLHPLIVMDVALSRVSRDEKKNEAAFMEVAMAARDFGGEFVILNHNTRQQLFPLIEKYFALE